MTTHMSSSSYPSSATASVLATTVTNLSNSGKTGYEWARWAFAQGLTMIIAAIIARRVGPDWDLDIAVPPHESISVQDWLASNDPFYTSATQSSDPKDVRLRGVEALSKLPTLDKDFISQNVDHNASVTARSDSLPAYSDVSETKQDGAMNGGSARPPAYTGVLSLSGSQDGSTLSGNLKGRLPVGQPSRPPNLPSLASPFTFLPNSRQENREQLSRYPQSLEALPRLGQTEFHNVTRTDGVPQIPALQNQMLSGPLQRVQDNVPQIPTHTTRPVEDCRSVRLPKLAPL